MNMKLTIGYINLWASSRGYWFDRFFKRSFELYNPSITIEILNGEPVECDILLSSLFGDVHRVKNVKARCKIFYTGENLDRFRRCPEYSELLEMFDIVLGFDYIDHPKYIRFPIWLLSDPFMPTEESILDRMIEERKRNMKVHKECLASFIARADENGMRRFMYDITSRIGEVRCPSTFMTNCPAIGDQLEDKMSFCSKTLINICPENSLRKGYVTEKIFDAFRSGCIPFYWGNGEHPESDIIKKSSYIYLDHAVLMSDPESHIRSIQKKIIDTAMDLKDMYIEDVFIEDSKYIVDHYYWRFYKSIVDHFGINNQDYHIVESMDGYRNIMGDIRWGDIVIINNGNTRTDYDIVENVNKIWRGGIIMGDKTVIRKNRYNMDAFEKGTLFP